MRGVGTACLKLGRSGRWCFCRVVPCDLFHSRFDIPSMDTAVRARAELLLWQTRPTPLWAFFPPVCTIWI